MTLREMRELCKEIKYAIMDANNRGDLRRVQQLKAKKVQIKQRIYECKYGLQPTLTSDIGKWKITAGGRQTSNN